MFRIKSIVAMSVSIVLGLSLIGCSQVSKEEQWALYNDGQKINSKYGMAGMDIGYTRVPPCERTVILAIIDSGIYASASASSKLYVNENEIPDDGIDNDRNGYVDDYNGWDFSNSCEIKEEAIWSMHATEIANIIAGDSEDYAGLTTNVLLLNIKIDEEDIAPEVLVEAIEYAENLGASVVNCSFTMSEDNALVYETMKDSSMLFVCAAGNAHEEKCLYPANYDLDNVISVGAIDNQGLISAYSNYGNDVDIAAPGENILVMDREGNTYFASGSSYATAFVSGIAAQLWSACSSKVSASEIKSLLLESAQINPSLRGYVQDGKIVNMENAFEKL